MLYRGIIRSTGPYTVEVPELAPAPYAFPAIAATPPVDLGEGGGVPAHTHGSTYAAGMDVIVAELGDRAGSDLLVILGEVES